VVSTFPFRVQHQTLITAMLALVVCLLVGTFSWVPPAEAHGELIEARPARNAEVGGVVDRIELQFIGLRHPGAHVLSIFGPDGTRVETNGDYRQDLQRLSLFFDPLTDPGEYLVNYRVDALDGDVSVDTFSFFFNPEADPPPPLQRRQIGEEQPRSGTLDAMIVGTAIFGTVVLAWIARRLWVTR